MSELEPIPKSPAFVHCYGCGPENERGLRLDFALDRAAGRVEASFTPQPAFGGYRNVVHGGVVSTLLDEAMGWALFGVEGNVGVTRRLEVEFLRPVYVERPYRVRGWIERADGRERVVRAEVVDDRDRVSARATGDWVIVKATKAGDLDRP